MKEDKKPFCVRYRVYFAVIGMILLLVLPQAGFGSTGARSPVSGERLVRDQLSHDGAASRQKPGMKTYVIKPGDSFSAILERSGLSRKHALYVSKKANKAWRLTKLKPGTVLELYFSPDGTGFQEVDYILSSRKKIVLYNGKVLSVVKGAGKHAGAVPVRTARAEDGDSRDLEVKKDGQEVAPVTGQPGKMLPAPAAAGSVRQAPASTGGMKIVSSYNPGLIRDIPASPEATYELLSNGLVLYPAFPAWDDFIENGPLKQDIRSKRDRKAASSKKQKQKKRNSRVAGKDREYFLRAPLSYRRISSHFCHNRINPVTNEAQPHLGIDYSAPSGTPVHSIGPGRILSTGWNGGYGKTVRILHTNGYVSQYAHLSRFSRSAKPGKKVRKGEIIGYVGMTGLATGPHLDFRVSYRGAFINPVRLEGRAMSISSSGKSRRPSRG